MTQVIQVISELLWLRFQLTVKLFQYHLVSLVSLPV